MYLSLSSSIRFVRCRQWMIDAPWCLGWYLMSWGCWWYGWRVFLQVLMLSDGNFTCMQEPSQKYSQAMFMRLYYLLSVLFSSLKASLHSFILPSCGEHARSDQAHFSIFCWSDRNSFFLTDTWLAQDRLWCQLLCVIIGGLSDLCLNFNQWVRSI